MIALTSMLRVVGGLDNLRRAPGPQGELKKIPRPGGFYIYMREDQSGYFVFPMSKLPIIQVPCLLVLHSLLTCLPIYSLQSPL